MIDRMIGAHSGLEVLRFSERGETFECVVPRDSIWTALKDNLLLREYERAGVSLDQVSGTVIDAGAHVGIFSLRASAYAERVIALEPDKDNYQLLELNLSRNLDGADHGRYQARKAALWTSSGNVMFDDDHDSTGGRVSQGTTSVSVPALTLADVVESLGHIDLLKLDIEGAEFPVLASAPTDTLRQIDVIVGELHLEANPVGHLQVQQGLEEAGFQVSLLNTPIHYWRDSLQRVLTNSRRLRGHWRLKATVAGSYALFPLLNRVIDLDRRTQGGLLSYVYARRV